MRLPTKSAQIDLLERIRELVAQSHKHFELNYTSFLTSKTFVYKSTLLEDDINRLSATGRPQLKLNSTEAYVSRLLGEFESVKPSPNIRERNPLSQPAGILGAVLIKLVEKVFYVSESTTLFYLNYANQLTGGWNVIKLYTDYENDETFSQIPKFKNVHDPCKVGFDPLARHPTKSDGAYAYEITELTVKDFKRQYPQARFDDTTDRGSLWSYSSDTDVPMVAVCDFYEKEPYRYKVLELSDKTVVSEDKYKEIVEQAEASFLIPPTVIRESRREAYHIIHYRLVKDCILEKNRNPYPELPLVFVDGNSAFLGGEQLTRSYVYNAMDAQRAKNIFVNVFIDEALSLQKSTHLLSERALPSSTAYRDYWVKPADRGLLIFNDLPKNPLESPIATPTILPRAPVPPEFLEFVRMAEKQFQFSLGAYDAEIGQGLNAVSGKAIIEGATASSAAAKPYFINFLITLQHLTKMILAVLPDIYTAQQSVEITLPDGKTKVVEVNDPSNPEALPLNYRLIDLNIEVSAGANLAVQRQRNIEILISAARAIPALQGIFDNPVVLKQLVLENLDLPGTGTVAAIIDAQAKVAAEQPQQPNPVEISAQLEQKRLELMQEELRLKEEAQMSKNSLEIYKVRQNKQTLLLKMVHENDIEQAKLQMEMARLQAGRERDATELKMRVLQQDSENYRSELAALERIQTPSFNP